MKEFLRNNLSNIPGKRFKHRYVVIESDDWGSIRMPNHRVFKTLKEKGLNVDNGDLWRYNYNDTLANEADFQELFKSLRKFKGSDGNHPVFTALSLVANPDFDRIKQTNFEEYHFESLTQTLDRYDLTSSLNLWKQGADDKLFVAEFHGREHLNVPSWMRMLQKNDFETMAAFEHGVWGFGNVYPKGVLYQAAFNLEVAEDIQFQAKAIQTGLKMFENIHGRKARYFVPPNGFFNRNLEKITAESGVEYLCAPKIQTEPLGRLQYKKSFHFIGQKSKWGFKYITRNAFFEPNDKSRDWVQSCLAEMENAFRWKKPAIISSHRCNYIGSLNVKNREHSLKELERLLRSMLQRWPDIRFVTSSELGDML